MLVPRFPPCLRCSNFTKNFAIINFVTGARCLIDMSSAHRLLTQTPGHCGAKRVLPHTMTQAMQSCNLYAAAADMVLLLRGRLVFASQNWRWYTRDCSYIYWPTAEAAPRLRGSVGGFMVRQQNQRDFMRTRG